MKNKRNNVLLGILVAFFITLISALSNNFVYASSNDEVLNQVRNLIKNVYVEDVPNEVLERDSIEDIIKGVKDPYTEYFTKDQVKQFNNMVNNNFCGIGIVSEKVEDGIKINQIFQDSPAEEVGIKVGDIITKIDSKSTEKITLKEYSKYIRGEEGTNVQLDIKRGEKRLKFVLERRIISIPTVDYKIMDNHIGYIRITSFGIDTPVLFLKALNNIKGKVNRYIIDLRNNGGGYVKSAYDIAGNFVGENIVSITKDKLNEINEYKGVNHGYIIDKPVIVLMNENTASASEILSLAIKDYNKAFFVGTKSFGKGIQQNILPLNDGGALKITTYKWYSPKGTSIHKTGLQPDFDTNKIDPLPIANLLYSGEDNKQNSLKIKILDKYFFVDIDKAMKEEFKSYFDYIMDKVNNDEIYLFSKNNWNKVTKEYVKNNIYLKDFKVFDKIVKNKEDDNLVIKFNKEVDPKTINDKNIKLINKDFLEPIKITTKVKKFEVLVSTNEKSPLTGDYYLIIDKVKSKDGKKLNIKTGINVEFK